MPSEEGGARGSEIVKLCLGCARRRAALAFPGGAHGAGGGGEARPPARAPGSLPRARALPVPATLPRAPRGLDAPGAFLEWMLRRARRRACERSRRERPRAAEGGPAGSAGAYRGGGRRRGAGGWRRGAGGPRELPPGPRCARHRLLKPKHVPKAVFSEAGRFGHPQFPPLGLIATDCKKNHPGGEAGGAAQQRATAQGGRRTLDLMVFLFLSVSQAGPAANAVASALGP